jgi:hypothetical protein
MRLVLAFCLILVFETTGFAENNSKAFVEGCRDFSLKGMRSFEMGECLGAIRSLMLVGPYLREDMKFCPDNGRTIFGMGAMNRYVKAHPDVLKSDTPNMDVTSMLILAFRDEWPCK